MEINFSEQENPTFSPPSGFKLRCTLQGHSDIITQIAWSSDGKKLASASKDHTVRLWNTETGELISVLEGHTDIVYGVVWAPDGEILASGSSDDTIKLWDAKTGQLRSQIEDVQCLSIAWSPDGETLASAGGKHSYPNIKFWDPRTGKKRKKISSVGDEEVKETFQINRGEISFRVRIQGLFSGISEGIV